jgi:hypothetical protein
VRLCGYLPSAWLYLLAGPTAHVPVQEGPGNCRATDLFRRVVSFGLLCLVKSGTSEEWRCELGLMIPLVGSRVDWSTVKSRGQTGKRVISKPPLVKVKLVACISSKYSS